jgi:hypothetical protein
LQYFNITLRLDGSATDVIHALSANLRIIYQSQQIDYNKVESGKACLQRLALSLLSLEDQRGRVSSRDHQ